MFGNKYCGHCGKSYSYCRDCGEEIHNCSDTTFGFKFHSCRKQFNLLGTFHRDNYCSQCGKSLPSPRYCTSCGMTISVRHVCGSFMDVEEHHICRNW